MVSAAGPWSGPGRHPAKMHDMQNKHEMKALAEFADKTFGDRPWTSRELLAATPEDLLPANIRHSLAWGGGHPVMSLGRLIRLSEYFSPAGRLRRGDHLWVTVAATYRKADRLAILNP